MSLSLKIVLVIIVITYIFFVLRAVKKKKMRLSYLIIWMVIGIVLLVSVILPNFVENVSKLIGFEMPINMIFSVAIFVIIYLIFDLISVISKQEKKIVLLIQEISILKENLKKIENDKKDK